MKYATSICFEFTPLCNMGHLHPWCPHTSVERFEGCDRSRFLTDGAIVDLAGRFVEDFGFRGMFCWHYYNEPLLEAERLFRLVEGIGNRVSGAKFGLWTNGTCIRPQMADALRKFRAVVVTNYGNIDLAMVRKTCPHAIVVRSPMDWRRQPRDEKSGYLSSRPCLRPFTEFCIDYFGNVHVCCYDWRGRSSPGNVLIDPLGEVVAAWQSLRDRIAVARRMSQMPEACRHCDTRDMQLQSWDPIIGMAAAQYAAELQEQQQKYLCSLVR